MLTPLALTLAVAQPPAAQGRPWKSSDFAAVEFMDDVRISPDGAYALVDVGHPDLSNDTFVTGYRSVALTDGVSATMPDNLTQPRWAPDRTVIAWLRPNKDGVASIVLTDARGRNLRPVTRGARSVVAYAWSPDGKQIAAIETAPAAAAKPARFGWMTAETDYRNTQPPKRDLYLIDVASGSERALTDDSWSYGGPVTDHDPSWSNDNKQLAVVRQPSPLYGDFEHAQYVSVAVAGGDVRDLIGHDFFAYPNSTPPQYAPHGNDVAYARTWDGLLPSREDLYVGERDVSAGLDRDLWSCGSGSAQWQGEALVTALLDGTSMRLFRIGPNASPQALTTPDGSVEAFSAAPNGRIAYVWSTPSQASELYVLDPGKNPRQVTHLGSLPGLAIAQTRTIEWQAPDGRTLHGQLTLPAGADPSAVPLIVEPHGGPQCAFDNSLSFIAQYLATNGYAYFRPDPRGSDGYGDWSYKAIVGDWGSGPMTDVLAGVDAVIASGVGRRDRLYIEGGSYGGYLTSWITTHDTRFKAAVAQVPVTDLLLEYSLSESPNIIRRFFGNKPALDQALLAKESPITYASDEKTPLLVIIGLRDTRAPYAGAIQFYKTVAENGTTARLLADTQAGHGPDDPKGFILWLQATLAWFAQYGGPPIGDAVMPQ